MARFSRKTLDAISKLVESVEGVCSIKICKAEGYAPRGIMQDCDAGVVPKEWVNQTTNGGFSGDEFAGTVTWKLGSHYLIASYNM